MRKDTIEMPDSPEMWELNALWLKRIYAGGPMVWMELESMRLIIVTEGWQKPLFPLYQALCAALTLDKQEQAHLIETVAPPWLQITRAVFETLQKRLSAAE